jgi:hypothetical protein
MNRNPFKALMILAVIATCTAAYAEELLYVSKVKTGVYQVYNASRGTTVYVSDVDAYIKSHYNKKVDGFGGTLSQKEFAKGNTTVQDTVSAVAQPVNRVGAAAYNAANLVPSWRKFTMPIKTFFGGKKQQPSRTGTGF